MRLKRILPENTEMEKGSEKGDKKKRVKRKEGVGQGEDACCP